MSSEGERLEALKQGVRELERIYRCFADEKRRPANERDAYADCAEELQILLEESGDA